MCDILSFLGLEASVGVLGGDLPSSVCVSVQCFKGRSWNVNDYYVIVY